FVDMDALITDRIGMPISDYFSLKGEAAFRQIESQLLEDLLSSNEYQVVATGGGVVTSAKNRELLRKNRKQNILLTASFDVLYD
ncbi:shikimate kinase, partial [Psychrobacter sanguinis]|nr:shikimate kinase [Psychrobacter sanguinis]